MEIKDCIPKNKFDFKGINYLKTLKYPAYKSILSELFEWIADLNWPVAPQIVPLLINAKEDIVPFVRDILKSNDSGWKYWTLSEVVDKMPNEIIDLLYEDLKEISESPNKNDKLDEVDEIAGSLIARLK